jgi:hypothetical protein
MWRRFFYSAGFLVKQLVNSDKRFKHSHWHALIFKTLP